MRVNISPLSNFVEILNAWLNPEKATSEPTLIAVLTCELFLIYAKPKKIDTNNSK